MQQKGKGCIVQERLKELGWVTQSQSWEEITQNVAQKIKETENMTEKIRAMDNRKMWSNNLSLELKNERREQMQHSRENG